VATRTPAITSDSFQADNSAGRVALCEHRG
jgi:hypothetical protein